MKNFNLVHEMRLSGVGWDEIKDLCDWFTDNDRKVYSGWLLGREVQDESNTLKYAKQKQDIRLLRKELGIERSINNEQIRDIALHQTFTNDVLKAIRDAHRNDVIVELKLSEDYDSDKTHVFTMSDYHYNGDIQALDTFDLAFNEIVKVVREKRLEEIYLIELGDTIEGAGLRTSQLMAIKKGMVEQTIDVASKYVQFLTRLSEIVNVKFYSVDSSNHSQLRNLGTKQNQLVEEDLMQILNHYIKTALPNLHMVNGKDLYVNINGFNFFIAHGHLVKSKEKYLEKVASNRNILIDYGFFGHFHHQITIDLYSSSGYDKKVFFVPSMDCGSSSNFEKDRELSSLPAIGYYVFDSVKGHVETRKLTI